MYAADYTILDRFRALLQEHIPLRAVAAFGSRIRAQEGERLVGANDSDLDVLVVTETLTPQIRRFVSDCAFEAGFDEGVLVSPVVFSREEWENEPYSASPLAQTIRSEGVFLPI